MPNPLVVIEDGVITGLLANGKVLEQIPALKELVRLGKRGKQSCRPCMQKHRQRNYDYAAAKRVIAGLRGAQLIFLKGVLDAARLRVWYVGYDKRQVNVTL